jgi:flagellar biogenesis protein FliO
MKIVSGRAVLFWLAAELSLIWVGVSGLHAAEGDTAAASPAVTPPATTSAPASRPDTPFPVLSTPAAPATTSGVEPVTNPEPLPPNLAPSLGTLLTLVIIYLLVLGGLGWFVLWLYRRLGRRMGGLVAGAEVKVCHQRMIGQRQALMVVRYRDHEYFLGVTPQQITRLDMRPIDADGELNQLDPAVLKAPASSMPPKSG